MRYYIIGVLINLAFLFAIRSTTDTSVENSIFRYTDATEYVEYAKGYIATGTFYDQDFKAHAHFRQLNGKETDGKPGYRRTVGYPIVIAFFMRLLGEKQWLLGLQIFNCFFFALLYLIIPAIAKELFGRDIRKVSFWFLLVSGIVFARVPQVLNNTIFAVCFFASILLGIKAIKSGRWWIYLAYILLVSFTATIRLNLAYYFVLHALIFLYLKGWSKWLVVTSCVLIISCNFNSFRNLYNHGKFYQGSIPAISVSEYLNKDVAEKGIVKTLWHNTKNVFLDNHVVNNIANWYGYNWKDFKGFNEQWFVRTMYFLYALMYIIFWIAAVVVICVLWQEKQWLLLLMVGYFALFWLAPAMAIGTGGSRLRLEFELFMFILIFGYVSNETKKETQEIPITLNR